jgi:hypothetical protein
MAAMQQEISRISSELEEMQKARQASEKKLTDTGELRQSRYLHYRVSRRFDNGELSDLMWWFGIDPDAIQGNSRNEKALNFVLHMMRRGKLPQLVEKLEQLRPNENWRTE